jgi:Glyoxalase/Bleomycin resistance protein/Dioxygenase superfamily
VARVQPWCALGWEITVRRGKEESDRVTFYVNWFFVTLIVHDGAKPPAKGERVFLYIKVDDVEEFHKAALSKGLKPDGEPERQPSGNREFVLRDPDGYNLVFFQTKQGAAQEVTDGVSNRRLCLVAGSADDPNLISVVDLWTSEREHAEALEMPRDAAIRRGLHAPARRHAGADHVAEPEGVAAPTGGTSRRRSTGR